MVITLLRGTPVIIGTMAFDGAEDGIYDKFDRDEYEPCAGISMLNRRGFISSLRLVGEA